MHPAEPPRAYTNNEPASDFRRTVRVLWGRVAFAAAGAHLVFVVVFAALQLPLLVWVNVASVAIHLISRWLSVSGRHAPAVVLLVSEVLCTRRSQHACSEPTAASCSTC